jgi:hypothetical protein
MKYLRAVVSSERRGTLYRKDLEPRNVFDLFIRRFVGDLVHDGTIHSGEHYSALVVPRYGQFLRPPTLKVGDTTGSDGSWIDLHFEDPVQPNTPVSFFTVELRVRERPLIYRGDFQLYELDYFWHSLEDALVQMKILQIGEFYRQHLYARDDDEGDLEHEKIYTARQINSPLIEIMPSETPKVSLLRRSLADFKLERVEAHVLVHPLTDVTEIVAEQSPGSDNQHVEILITRPALEATQTVARSGAQVEEGGVLVGHVYENTASPGYLVEITDHIAAEDTLASEVELRYTFESWQHRTELLKKYFPGKRIVGWYHTHLVKMQFYTDATRTSTFGSELFFSRDDVFMHRQFFREKWYVAMVLNPEGTAAFFQWSGDEIVPSRRFYVISHDGEA